MADVEMTDAAPKKAKAGPSGGDTADGKKKFEVKKVIDYSHTSYMSNLLTNILYSGTQSHSGLGTS